MKGTIKKLVPERGFGFVKGEDDRDYFFHRTTMARDLPFESLDVGEGVSFEIEQSDKGPRAVDVRRG
jgi:cold shock protein